MSLAQCAPWRSCIAGFVASFISLQTRRKARLARCTRSTATSPSTTTLRCSSWPLPQMHLASHKVMAETHAAAQQRVAASRQRTNRSSATCAADWPSTRPDRCKCKWSATGLLGVDVAYFSAPHICYDIARRSCEGRATCECSIRITSFKMTQVATRVRNRQGDQLLSLLERAASVFGHTMGNALRITGVLHRLGAEGTALMSPTPLCSLDRR
mmetsp:Transcript_25924/g.73491  ORF Transcript_25924/g.73491 Transcript_25924/m.73491 type:complete len:213 (+) Transcript_25924:110-748(+)